MGLDMYLFDRTGERRFGYWRKANAIHGYIVHNFADDVDECQKIKLTRENLSTLRKHCLMVLADNSLAWSLLPPTQGFFFGGYDVDNYYYDDLRDTVRIIDKALQSKLRQFIYRASW